MTDRDEQNIESLLGDFSVPDKSDLGWTPAETVFVTVQADEPATEFFPVAVAADSEPTVIEFELADIEATELIADFDVPGGSDIDLNVLLSSFAPELDSQQGDVGPPRGESDLLSALDDVINDPQPVDASSSLIETTGLEFGGLTVIIDDDGTDTVAI